MRSGSDHTCHCKGGKSFNSGHLPGRTVFLTSDSQPLLRNLIAFECYGSESGNHTGNPQGSEFGLYGKRGHWMVAAADRGPHGRQETGKGRQWGQGPDTSLCFLE